VNQLVENHAIARRFVKRREPDHRIEVCDVVVHVAGRE
jgi:hypothetical protein